jgi:hypothetical protein
MIAGAIDYHDFVFEEDGHRYTTADGIVRPSITQVLNRVGIYDFSMVPADVLENARRRGVNVHKWCAEYDRHGYLDETWMADDEIGYFEAWLKFRRESKILIRRVETPIVRSVGAWVIAGTPDVEAFMGRNPFVIERKACRVKHAGWALQTAMQEMLLTGRPRVGHISRMTVQLKPDGTYRSIPYDDETDGSAALAALTLCTTQDQFEADDARLTLNAWCSNHNLKIAA